MLFINILALFNSYMCQLRPSRVSTFSFRVPMLLVGPTFCVLFSLLRGAGVPARAPRRIKHPFA